MKRMQTLKNIAVEDEEHAKAQNKYRILLTIRRTRPFGRKWGCVLWSECSLCGSLPGGGGGVEQGHRRQE